MFRESSHSASALQAINASSCGSQTTVGYALDMEPASTPNISQERVMVHRMLPLRLVWFSYIKSRSGFCRDVNFFKRLAGASSPART